jgi:hypothetical protein
MLCQNIMRPIQMVFGRSRRKVRVRGSLLVGIIGLLASLNLTAADPPLATKIQAAYLSHFAHYVTWPSNAFTEASSPWKIGILGSDPFGDVLEKTLEGRTEQNRSFEIFRADTLDQLPPCQIVFIAHKDPAKRRAALNALKKQPVLTAGDSADFLKEGGIIRFQVKDRVEMSVNLDQARAVSLKIQPKMLEVATEVLNDGTVRKLR